MTPDLEECNAAGAFDGMQHTEHAAGTHELSEAADVKHQPVRTSSGDHDIHLAKLTSITASATTTCFTLSRCAADDIKPRHPESDLALAWVSPLAVWRTRRPGPGQSPREPCQLHCQMRAREN